MKDFMLTILEDDEYRLHVAVAEAFGSGQDSGAPFPLYRRQPGTTITIVRPSVVPERLMALGRDVRTLATGEEAGFELAAYAARSGGGKRFAIKTDPERVHWLEERGARLGFDLLGTPDLRTATSRCGRPRSSAFSARRSRDACASPTRDFSPARFATASEDCAVSARASSPSTD